MMHITLNHPRLTKDELYIFDLKHIIGVEVTFLHEPSYKAYVASVDKLTNWGPIAFLSDGTSTYLDSLLFHDGNSYVPFNEYTMNTWRTSITYIETKKKKYIDQFKVKISDISNIATIGAPTHGF